MEVRILPWAPIFQRNLTTTSMRIVHYIDRNLLYVKITQIQPLLGFKKKDDHMPPKRHWNPPILYSRDSHNVGQYADSITLNRVTLEHLDELIEGLQAAKEKFKKHLDN